MSTYLYSSKFIISLQGKKCFMFCFALIFLMVEAISLARGGLLLTRYSNPGKTCKLVKNNSSNSTTFQVVQQPIESEYMFHMTQYAVGLLLRCMEYVLLTQGVYNLAQDCHVQSLSLLWHKTWRWGIFWGMVLIPVLLLPCLATPSLGIVSELSFAASIDECYKHDTRVYILYVTLTMFTYFFAYCVRVAMVFTTIAVCKLWFPEGYYTCARVKKTSNNLQIHLPEQLNEAEQFIEDWRVVSDKHGELATKYEQIGQEVERITQIFQTWFMLPWIIFFISVSAETKNVLKPWANGEELSAISTLHYTVYNVNQILSLLVPYLCGLKMNMFHDKFYKELREEQMAADQSCSCRGLARIMHIEKEQNYDFVARVWGTSIKIQMNSPLYVIFLLIGIFFTVCGSLYS